MQIISEYIRGVMERDPIAGNDLLRLNYPHVAKELNLPPTIEEANKLAHEKMKNKNK